MTEKPPLVDGACVKVVFPMPSGNATVILRPTNDEKNGFGLESIPVKAASEMPVLSRTKSLRRRVTRLANHHAARNLSALRRRRRARALRTPDHVHGAEGAHAALPNQRRKIFLQTRSERAESKEAGFGAARAVLGHPNSSRTPPGRAPLGLTLRSGTEPRGRARASCVVFGPPRRGARSLASSRIPP